MSKKTLNWGLLSTANINNALIPPLQFSKRNHLLAVASRSQANADAYAKEKHIERAHGTYEALLADPDIDVIYNPLPNHMHTEWTIKAVEAGKHVLCEKPIALTVEDVDAIKTAAHKHGRVVAEAFMYRHHPQTLQVQELVKSGALGTLKLIRGGFGFFLDRKKDIRLDPTMGGGSIWDVGCYPISYARTIVGEAPLEVFGTQVTGPTGVDLTFTGQMKFANNILAQIDCSFDIPLYWGVEVLGSEASLRIPSPFKPGVKEMLFVTRGSEMETIKVKGQELYIGEVEDMADAILLGKDSLISLDDSRANVASILALLESARTRQPVSL